MPRGTSSADDAHVVTSTTAASWPWNLSTVPTRTPVIPAASQRAADRPDLRVVGRDDEDVAPGQRPGRRRPSSRAAEQVADLRRPPRRPPRATRPRCRRGRRRPSAGPGATPVERAVGGAAGPRSAGPRTRGARPPRRAPGASARCGPGSSRARRAACRGPSTSQPSADRSTGSGCRPWVTCGSCCGSPSSSRFRAAVDTAIVSASENCPASSMTSRSNPPVGDPVAAGEVPLGAADDEPARLPGVERDRVLAGGQRLPDGVVGVLVLRLLADLLRRQPGVVDGAQHVLDHRVRLRDDADLPALRRERRDHVTARVRLAGAGRSLHGQVRAVEVEHGVDDRLGGPGDVVGPGQRQGAGPRRDAAQEVDRGQRREVGQARGDAGSTRSRIASTMLFTAGPGVGASAMGRSGSGTAPVGRRSLTSRTSRVPDAESVARRAVTSRTSTLAVQPRWPVLDVCA